MKKFQTDLREVFGFLIRQKDKEELVKYVRENKRFFCLSEEAYDIICAVSGTKRLQIKKDKFIKGGGMDMCQAIEEMLQDEREEGMRKITLLFRKLVEESRFNELKRATKEIDYRDKMLEEYGLL